MKALCLFGKGYLKITTGEVYDVEECDNDVPNYDKHMYRLKNDDGDEIYTLKARFELIDHSGGEDDEEYPE